MVGACGSDDDGGSAGTTADPSGAPDATELEGRTFEVATTPP